MDLGKGVNVLLFLIGTVFILIVGESLLIQMILAFLIWFLIRSLRTWLMKTPKIGTKIPQWLWTVVSIVVLTLVGILFVDIMVNNINELSKKSSVYVDNFKVLSSQLEVTTGLDVNSFVGGEINDDTIRGVISQLGNSVTSFVGNIFMITLYVMFMFSEETVFKGKLVSMFPNTKKRNEITLTLNRIGESIQSYIGLKTLVSFITAFLSYIALYFIGIDAPFFWAILIFAMNFIPTVGSLVATVFPAIMVLFQFGELLPCILVISIVGGFQVIVGNVVEPKIMGRSLNLSSLVVLIALGFWTAIWGVVGAVLSVPITVVLMIIFNQYESTRIISKALSERGQLNE